jgi:hypothetical protein
MIPCGTFHAMSEAFDGESIAGQRIVEEAERRTRFLDLGGLDLSMSVPRPFLYRNVLMLNRGDGIRPQNGAWHAAYNHHPARPASGLRR